MDGSEQGEPSPSVGQGRRAEGCSASLSRQWVLHELAGSRGQGRA